jgi:hypothetical protein
VGKPLSSIAGVVVKLRDGLVSTMEEWRRTEMVFAGQPVMLGEEQTLGEEQEEPARVSLPTIELKPDDGLSISIIHLPDGQLDIEVATEPAMEGRVRLFRLVPIEGGSHEEPTGHSRRLEEGRAQLRNCPEGILKIAWPDGRETVICVQPGEE